MTSRPSSTRASDPALRPVAAPSGFATGARIRTEHGERAVDTLRPGDKVVTSCGKLETVKDVTIGQPDPRAAQVLISKDALGPNQPRRDIVLNGGQNIILNDPALEQLFDCRSARAKARDLTILDGVSPMVPNAANAQVAVVFDTAAYVFCSGVAVLCASVDQHPSDVPVLSRADLRTFARETGRLPRKAAS